MATAVMTEPPVTCGVHEGREDRGGPFFTTAVGRGGVDEGGEVAGAAERRLVPRGRPWRAAGPPLFACHKQQ